VCGGVPIVSGIDEQVDGSNVLCSWRVGLRCYMEETKKSDRNPRRGSEKGRSANQTVSETLNEKRTADSKQGDPTDRCGEPCYDPSAESKEEEKKKVRCGERGRCVLQEVLFSS